jgi:GntR family transcriptional repressor for pyruvate dehydrogenase complex
MPGSMVPIDRSGITELVVQRIKELLTKGELKAGSRLPPERELAERLQISRPSLRTALKALSVMGIIRAKPGSGTYIAESLPEIFTAPMQFLTLINQTSAEELFEARQIIEVGLAGLAAERATPEDLQRLADEIEGMRRHMDDPEIFFSHDIQFHKAMADAANNPLMSRVMDTIAELLYQFRLESASHRGHFEGAVRGHERILQAITRRDPIEAKEMLSLHLRDALQGLAEVRQGYTAESPPPTMPVAVISPPQGRRLTETAPSSSATYPKLKGAGGKGNGRQRP